MAGQSKKGTGKRTAAAKNGSGSPSASFTNEVILWVVLAVSIILFISNFGIAGKAGKLISAVFFGLFGLVAYVFPLLLFAGTAFTIANKNNKAAIIKVSASVVFTLFICMFLELIGGNSLSKSPLDAYLWAAEHKYGGGLFGGLLTWLIRPNLGTVSAYVIDIIVLIICMVLITERSLWKRIASGSFKVYHTAKNETKRQHQQYTERRQRRMDHKVVGVSTDTSIKNAGKPKATDAVSELHPEMVSIPDFPIHLMGQTLKQEAKPVQMPGRAAVGMDFQPDVIAFPESAKAVPAQDAQTDMDDGQGYIDNVIPIASQKVVLQPNLPEEDADAVQEMEVLAAEASQSSQQSQQIDGAEDIFAKTNELFSEMFPDSGDTVFEEAEAAQTLRQEAVPEIEQEASGAEDELQAGSGAHMQDLAIHIEQKKWNETAKADSKDSLSAQIPQAAGDFADNNRLAETDDLDEMAEIDEAGHFETADDFIAQQLPAADISAHADAKRPSVHASADASVQPVQKAAAKTVPGASAAAHSAAQPGQSKAEIDANVTEIGMQLQPPVKREYVHPDIGLLKPGDPNQTGDSRQHLQETALKLQQILKNFGVNVTILNVSCGPSVTRYEIQPEMGVKVSKIVNLADDIKLNLAAADIRIEAPIPGKAAIGIEVPNKETVPVVFRDLIEAEEFEQQKSPCTFAVGKDIAGQVVVTDICKMPHLLIAGATGSGKSVCINTIIMSIIYKADPEDVKMIMVDPKVVELSVYNGIPHLLLPVVTDPKKAAGALHWAVAEMMERYQKFANYGVRNIKGYNAKIKQISDINDADKPQKMPYIVIIVDELADLMMAAPNDVEDAICRLAQLARAAGIHLIIATQRPSVNVITGLIKANMPSRIAFSVSSGIDSRTILDMVGAEKLLGKGDMLFYPQGCQKPLRVQGAFVSDSEVSKVVEFLTERNGAAQYSSAIEEKVSSAASGSGAVSIDSSPENDRDAYFADAAKLLIDKEKASVSMLQRYFKIGFNRAARIMDQLEEAGVVGPEEGTKPRKILMGPEEFEQYVEEAL